MNIKRLLLVLAAFALLLGAVPQKSSAQWSLGASYEIRDKHPENGFGLRLERDILQQLPVVNVALRAHFSYFSEENSVSEGGITYSRELSNYDYGLAAVGGISVGLLSPYVGLGLGSNTFDVKRENAAQLDEEESNSSIYWNGFFGAKVNPVPFISPFVEYRLQNVSDYEDLGTNIEESKGRLIFGVSVAF